MTSDISNHAYVMKLKEQCSQAPFSFPYIYFTLCISSLRLFLNYIHPWWLTDWFKIEKGIRQGCILLSCLFNLHAEYIMWNARLDEAQAGIKIARGNINNFRYADDTTLMAESEEELKSLLVKVREWKIWLKIQTIKKTKIMAIWSHHFMANRWGNNRNSDGLYFLGLQNHCRQWQQPWN